MIRICHLITDMDTGGAERTLANLIPRLDQSKFQNDVLTLIDPGDMAQSLRNHGTSVRGLGMRIGRPTIGGFVALVKHLRATQPTILQTWMYHADLAGLAASWLSPVKHVVWNIRCSDIIERSAETKIKKLVQLNAHLASRPDAVIVNSERGRGYHEKIGYRPKHWIDIPNGVDVERFYPRPSDRSVLRDRFGIRHNDVVIGMVARFHPMKDHGTFLEAARYFADRHENTRFVLCGARCDSSNADLSSMIAKQGLTGQVLLLGNRTDPEAFYSMFDIHTLASAYGEGFPNVLMEAMACGVPCVATNVGDSARLVGDTGFIVPPRNARALALAWEDALLRRDELGSKGLARVRAQFSLDQMCRRYEAFYQTLVGSNA